MKINKQHLQKIIQEVAGMVDSIKDFKNLQPGDRLTLNGAPIVVASVDHLNAYVDYVEEGKTTLKHFDYRYAVIYPDDPPDMVPELEVIFTDIGPAPKNTRRSPRKRGPGRSYSVYD